MAALVFDFGLAHIGIAIAEPRGQVARGLATIAAKHGKPRWDALDPLIAEWQPSALVVGLPLNMDGTPSAMSNRARAFGQQLAQRYGLTVDYADERLSTFEAASRGAEGQRSHATAAAVIAETWLSRAPQAPLR